MGFNVKNDKQLIIGKDVAKTGTTPDTLVEGELGLFSTNGTLLTAATAATADKAVVMKMGANSKLQISDVIYKAGLLSASGTNGVAAQEQIAFVGFNGTSGALDTTNDTLFFIKLMFQELLVSNTDGRVIKHGQYKTPVSGTTQAMLANGLQKSLIANFSREPQDTIKAELLIDNAGVALGTGTATSATVKATKGSKIVSGWANVDDSTTNAAMAVGDFLRFGTAVTDPCYKIVAIDATNDFLTLDAPYQGADALFNDTGLERIPAATAASADFGIKITGEPLEAKVGKFIPAKITFDVTLENFATTTVTASQASLIGTNTAEIIAEEENFYQAYQGDTFRDNRVAFPKRAEAENILYDSIDIRWTEPVLNGAIKNYPEKELKIAIPATRSANAYSATNGYEDVFEAFLGVTLGL